MDFSAIFLQWDSLFWLAEQTTPYLSHRSCLYKESSVCSVAPAVYFAIAQFDFALSFSLTRACFFFFCHNVKVYESIESLSFSCFLQQACEGKPLPVLTTVSLSG